jgi:trypsin
MAALFKDTEFRCGGTLIAPDIILTAAHCAEFVNIVQIGRLNFTSLDSYYELISDEDYEEFRIVGRAVHPEFRPRTLNKDVALLKLSKESLLEPIPMNRDSDIPLDGDALIVMGYGKTYESSPLSNKLPQTQEFYMTNEQCRESEYSNKDITSSMM